ncbi:MAG TPA: glycerate kinase [Bacilli bacterium]
MTQLKSMQFLVAPDSFKGSLSALEAGVTIQEAVLAEMPNAAVHVIPMADGGEGTVDAFLYATAGERVTLNATGPQGERMETFYGVLGDGKTVVLEMAAIAGLMLVPNEKRNVFNLTTFGVGECILHALNAGYRKFIIGIGGSATNDGGLGMLQALGVSFKDSSNHEVSPFARSLREVASVDFGNLDHRLSDCEIRVACDVDNPLYGSTGASQVFGPQKGATPAQVEQLDRALEGYAAVVERHLGQSYNDHPGAGASGGLGFALLAIGAQLVSGAEIIAEAAGLEQKLVKADWLITGEGRTDSQSLRGKVPFFLAELAKKHNVSTIVLSGSLELDLEPMYPYFGSLHSIMNGPMTLDQAIEQAKPLLYHKTRNVIRLLGK